MLIIENYMHGKSQAPYIVNSIYCSQISIIFGVVSHLGITRHQNIYCLYIYQIRIAGSLKYKQNFVDNVFMYALLRALLLYLFGIDKVGVAFG